MPHRVLQVVAGLIVLVALSAFTLGVINAPQRGRMPGEKADGEPGGPAPIVATEATPLSQERIEGPPPPPELTPEEKAKQQADKEAREAAKLAAASASAAAPAPPAQPPPGDKVGDIIQNAPPPAEEPPH
ncbi:MAG: hypothetical protein ACHP7A_00655 [Caulobacterales bacterium]